jgi:hypothetical protein
VLRRRRERRGVVGNKEESEMMGGRVRNIVDRHDHPMSNSSESHKKTI